MANVVTGAVTQAGWGALAGGVVGSATGQGFFEGATAGAAIGAGTGAATGLLAPGLAAGSAGSSAASAADPALRAPTQGLWGLGGATAPAGGAAGAAGGAAGGAGGATTGLFGALKSKALSTLTNPAVLGPVIAGVGKGLGGSAAEQELAYLREREDKLRKSYDGTAQHIWPKNPFAAATP